VAEFVELSPGEKQKLIDEYGPDQFKAIIDRLNFYKGSTGKKYKSDYMTIRNWVIGAANARPLIKIDCPETPPEFKW